MSARAIIATIYDLLADDVCLASGYLEPADATTIHGSEDFCDMPLNSHFGRPIRREEQGWPGDFTRAVVTFGRLSRSPRSINQRPWIESWTFVVGVWVRQTPKDEMNVPSPGDLWALDIYDMVVRILGWQAGGAALPLECGEGGMILVPHREHVGDVVDLHFNDKLAAWEIQTRFRWTVISRGLVPPIPDVCCAT
jgi:hypothetical protein